MVNTAVGSGQGGDAMARGHRKKEGRGEKGNHGRAIGQGEEEE